MGRADTRMAHLEDDRNARNAQAARSRSQGGMPKDVRRNTKARLVPRPVSGQMLLVEGAGRNPAAMFRSWSRVRLSDWR